MRVYKYGLLAPSANAAVVREQLSAAHRYRNTLVEIERGRRAAHREILGERVRDLELAARDAEAKVDEAVQAVRRERARTRARSDTPEQRAAIKAAREAAKVARKALAEARKSERESPEVQRALDTIADRAGELQRSARAHCGVYWGTYLLIEEEMQASAKMPLYDGVEPNDPRFARWDGEGTVGVQLQGGLACALVTKGEDMRIRIVGNDPVYKTLQLRVGSEGRDPVWAEWPIKMHRPLPQDGVVKRAGVHLRRVGPREVWAVTITVAEPARAARCGSGAVAIDLGWRRYGDRIRVARWLSSDGEAGEIAMDARYMRRMQKLGDLAEIRAKRLTQAQLGLVWWFSALPAIPAWMPALHHLVQWRAPKRMAMLLATWRENRFEGDESVFATLEAWVKQDRHLWEWSSNQRVRTLRHRKEVFRVAGAMLAKRYGEVVFEDFDLAKMAWRPRAEDDAENEAARAARHLVAPAELRLAIRESFLSRGGIVTLVDPANTTRECHACGFTEAFDAAASVDHTCSACGVRWDQDHNACAIMLARRERLGAAETPEGARDDKPAKTEGRWERAARLRTEKLARREALAKADENV